MLQGRLLVLGLCCGHRVDAVWAPVLFPSSLKGDRPVLGAFVGMLRVTKLSGEEVASMAAGEGRGVSKAAPEPAARLAPALPAAAPSQQPSAGGCCHAGLPHGPATGATSLCQLGRPLERCLLSPTGFKRIIFRNTFSEGLTLNPKP